jgi:hypothetical protein
VTPGSIEAAIVRSAGAIKMVIGTEAVRAGWLLSVTSAIKLEDPVVVGTPEMVPVAGIRVKPVGNLPEAIDHM